MTRAEVAAAAEMPHDPATEAAILGALLIDPTLVGEVDGLRTIDFYTHKNALIFGGIVEAHADTGSGGPIAVREVLKAQGRLEEAGGDAEIINMTEQAIALGGLGYYADLLRAKTRQRELAAISAAIAERAKRGEDTDDLLRDLERIGSDSDHRSALDRLWSPLAPGTMSTVPKARRYILRHPNGDGLLARGKAGVLSSEGGAGKTNAMLQMAVAIVTGRPWFDHYLVDPDARGGRVAALLAEEDQEEVARRLFRIGEAMHLSDGEKQLVEERVVVLPMAGERCALLAMNQDGHISETPLLQALRRRLRNDAGPDGWAAVLFDPLARLAGGDVNRSTEAATAIVQATESLVRVAGNPAVLTAHHSSKAARTAGKVDSRGLSDLTDGWRWHGTLRVDDKGQVWFKQAKSNYSKPMTEELQLLREDGGVLRAVSAVETAGAKTAAMVREQTELENQVDLVVANLRRLGSAGSIDEACTGCGVQLVRARTAFRRGTTTGRIVNNGTERRPRWCVCVTPPYPPDDGTSSSGGGPTTSGASRTTRDDGDDEGRRDLR